MPLISLEKYQPNVIFRNGHISTIYPYLFRNIAAPKYKRERWLTQDKDFFDVDLLTNETNKSMVIINHGLEGSSSSQYVKGLAAYLYNRGHNICAINNRSCSGVLNKSLGFYHSGFTKDVGYVVNRLSKSFTDLHIVGYSMGGNQMLKYLGGKLNFIPTNLRSAISFSVPVDLESSAKQLTKISNKFYTWNFTNSLRKKVLAKSKLYPKSIDLSHLSKVNELRDFDEYYTSRLHGFTDAEDYYNQSSAKQYLQNISIPTLLVNAQDDPFLAPPCFPEKIASNSNYFYFYMSKFGGHAGFPSFGRTPYWTEVLVDNWISQKVI